MQRRIPSGLVLFVLGLVAAGCSDEPKVEDSTAVQRVEIAPAEKVLEIDEELDLVVRAYNARGGEVPVTEVRFESSAPDVATVSGEGMVRALQPGAATITATVSGKRGTMEVRVLEAVHSISIVPDPVEMLTQESVQLEAIAYDASGNRLEGRTFKWEVENDFVATVDQNGLLTSKRREDSTVVFARYGDVEGQATVIVTKRVHSIDILPPSPIVREKSELQLEAIPRDDGGMRLEGRPIAWSSADESIATVSEEGVLRGVSPGEVEISARSGDAVGVVTVEVRPERVHRMEIEPKEAEVVIGETLQFTVRTYNEAGEELFGRPLSWKVIDPELLDQSYAKQAADLSEGGLLRANRPFRGLVEVSVPGDGVSTTAKIHLVLRMKGVAAGHHHTCALTPAGEAWCWGENSYGQTGMAPNSERIPAPVETDLRFAFIAAGSTHTCGLTEEGVAHCWGSNEHGQLGDGTTQDSLTPVAVARPPNAVPFAKIYAGDGYTCAIDTDHRAYCWGLNVGGRLGNGQRGTDPVPLPEPVMGEVDEDGNVVPIAFKELSLGSHRVVSDEMLAKNTMTCGISLDGVGYCWGENDLTDHGIGAGPEPLASAMPVRLAGDLEFKRISVGAAHACGLTVTGEAYCWGRGGSGELGDGGAETNHRHQAPHPVDTDLRFEHIGAGNGLACALTAEGELYCWGRMERATDIWRIPTRMGGSEDWVFDTISAGDFHLCGIDPQGAVYCWGSNFNGQLGNTGSAQRVQTPVRIFPEEPVDL